MRNERATYVSSDLILGGGLCVLSYAGWLSAELKPVHDALFKADQAPSGCLEGTRVSLLRDILAWATADGSERVFWLSGLAGTGKSAIARTICEELSRRNLLLSSFFISRNSVDRRSALSLFHTMVYHISRELPEFFRHICDTLTQYPETRSLPFADQADKLLLGPLQKVTSLGRPRIIVIDAFDECERRNGREGGDLLPSLLKAIRSSPVSIRLLVTSRAEKIISDMFMLHRTYQAARLHDIESDIVDKDIARYLQLKFREIVRSRGVHVTGDWPTPAQLSLLVQKAAGLFVYAATIIRFISKEGRNPVKQLEVLLSTGPTSISSSRFHDLDILYTQVLANAIGNEPDDVENAALVRTIVGTLVLLQDPLSVSALARLLSKDLVETREMVERITAVLTYNEVDPIRLFHPSFPDYFLDPHRCADARFQVVAGDHHGMLAHRCLVLMNEGLRQDMCGIGDVSVANQDVPDLADRLVRKVDEELQYACKHWLHHLSQASRATPEILDALRLFGKTHIFHWIELLSLLQALGSGLTLLERALAWLSVGLSNSFAPLKLMAITKTQVEDESGTEIKTLMQDAERVIQAFHEPISRNVLQIYISVLVMMPNCALYRSLRSADSYLLKAELLSTRQNKWSPRLNELRGHSSGFLSVAFMRDNVHIVSGSDDNTVRLWNFRTLECVVTFTGHHTGWVHAVACSPDGSVIASGGDNAGVALWDVRTGTLLRVLGEETEHSAIAFSPDSSRVACGTYEGTLQVWEVVTGSLVISLEGHTKAVLSVVFSSDGGTLVTGSHDSAVKIWSIVTGEAILTLTGHSGDVNSVALSPDDSRIVSGADDHKVMLWDARTGDVIRTMAGHEYRVISVKFASLGSCIFSGDIDGMIRKWDANTGECLSELATGQRYLRDMAVSPDEMRIACARDDGVVELLDASALHDVTRLAGHDDRVYAVAFAPDGLAFASCSSDHTVRVWKTRTGECLRTIQYESWVLSVLFSPDGSVLASGTENAAIRIFNTSLWQETGFLTWPLDEPFDKYDGAVLSLAFSADGSRIASGSFGTVRVWNANTQERIAVFNAEHTVTALAFSPDMSRIATGSSSYLDARDNSESTRVWDADTGERVATLADRGHYIHSLAFSPDGSRVISRGMDGSVRVGAVPHREQHRKSSLLVDGGAADEAPLRYLWHVDIIYVEGRIEGWLYFGHGAGGKPVRVCWLPTERRPSLYAYYPIKLCYAWHGDIVVIGSEKGTITILDLSDVVASL